MTCSASFILALNKLSGFLHLLVFRGQDPVLTLLFSLIKSLFVSYYKNKLPSIVCWSSSTRGHMVPKSGRLWEEPPENSRDLLHFETEESWELTFLFWKLGPASPHQPKQQSAGPRKSETCRKTWYKLRSKFQSFSISVGLRARLLRIV